MMKPTKNRMLGFTMPPGEANRLIKQATDDWTTPSDLIRRYVREGLDRDAPTPVKTQQRLAFRKALRDVRDKVLGPPYE